MKSEIFVWRAVAIAISASLLIMPTPLFGQWTRISEYPVPTVDSGLKRVPDPQGVKGAFQYTVKMLRNGAEYTLEIVVREADWTILHFLYR
jgi:hypothetical protein